jgi:hypothetical protein
MSFLCSAPKGTTFNVVPGSTRIDSGEDGYSGVTPRFLFDLSRPDELLVFWGSTKRLGDLGPDPAERAAVVSVSPDEIVAVAATHRGTWVYALHLPENIGFFTRTDRAMLGVSVPRASVFWSVCQYTISQE